MVHPKRPRDLNQRAKLLVELATGEKHDPSLAPESQQVKAGRLGGLKGGKARAKILSPKKRKTIAKKAAKARWSKK